MANEQPRSEQNILLTRGNAGEHVFMDEGFVQVESGAHRIVQDSKTPEALMVSGGTVTSLAMHAPQSVFFVNDAYVEQAEITGNASVVIDDARVKSVTVKDGSTVGILDSAFASSLVTGERADVFTVIGNGSNSIKSGGGNDAFHLQPWDFFERGLGNVFGELGRGLWEGPTVYNPEGAFGGVDPGELRNIGNGIDGGEGMDTVYLKDAAQYRYVLNADDPARQVDVVNGHGYTMAVLQNIESIRDEGTGEEILSTLTPPENPPFQSNIKIIKRKR